MRKIPNLLVLSILFIFLRLVVLFTESPRALFFESFRATAAYDFISDRNFSLFDYSFRHNEGGSLVVALMAALVFKIFGMSVFSLHLVPLFFTFISFVIGYYLVKKYNGLKKARLFAIIFIFAPQAYIRLTLLIFGNHVESILFTFIIIYCLGNIFDDTSSVREFFYSCLLGLVCGFSIWFAYINMMGVLTFLICVFIFNRSFYMRKTFLFFLIFFAVGIAPLVIYNLTYAHGGVGVVLYKPLWVHFCSAGFTQILKKAYALFMYDFPQALFFCNGLFIPRKLLAYFNYVVYMVIFLSFFKVKLRDEKYGIADIFSLKKKKIIDVFVFIYICLFLLIYLVGDFKVDPGNIEYGKGYRYIVAILPLFFILFSRAYIFLLYKKRISIWPICILIFFNLLGMVKLFDLKNFLKSTRTSPLSYQSFGWSIANKFGYDFDKCLLYSQRIRLNSRNYFFAGLGEEMAYYYVIDSAKLNLEFERIPEQYRPVFFISLGGGINSKLFPDSGKIVDTISKVAKKYRKYAYVGLGADVAIDRFSNIEYISRYISNEYKCLYYEGVGAGVLYSKQYNLKECNDILGKVIHIKEQYRQCCYSGISFVSLDIDENVGNPENFYKMLESYSSKIDPGYRSCFLDGFTEKRMLLREIYGGKDKKI